MKDVRASGLQVSNHIGNRVEVHPLNRIYVPYPKGTDKKRLE